LTPSAADRTRDRVPDLQTHVARSAGGCVIDRIDDEQKSEPNDPSAQPPRLSASLLLARLVAALVGAMSHSALEDLIRCDGMELMGRLS
jgi:hypothetical protein